MAHHQDLLREFAALNNRRTREGIDPLEYQRWLDLHRQLQHKFPNLPPFAKRGATRMRVEFRDRDDLRASVMSNIRPVGIFVSTPFAAEAGTQLELVVLLKATGETFAGRVDVVSNNVGPGFSTEKLGMGLRLRGSHCELRGELERICGVSEGDDSAA